MHDMLQFHGIPEQSRSFSLRHHLRHRAGRVEVNDIESIAGNDIERSLYDFRIVAQNLDTQGSVVHIRSKHLQGPFVFEGQGTGAYHLGEREFTSKGPILDRMGG